MPNNNKDSFDAEEALGKLRKEQAGQYKDIAIDSTVDNKILEEENEQLKVRLEKAFTTIEKQDEIIKNELMPKITKLENENKEAVKIINKLIERFWGVTDEEKKTNEEIEELLKKMRENNKKTQGYIATDEEGKQGLGHMEKESSGGKIPIEAFEIINKSLDNLKLEELQDKINRTNNERNKTQGHAVKEGGKTSTENNNPPTMN